MKQAIKIYCNYFGTKGAKWEDKKLTPTIKIQKTVYPNGKPQKSLTGIGEFYGLQEGKL